MSPDFICCSSFVLPWVDRFTIRPEILVSVIAKVVALSSSQMTQFDDLVNIRYVSQLINDILPVLPKLLRYFNGTTASISTVPSLPISFANIDLNLNNLESVMLSSDSSLQYHQNLPSVLNNYHYILLNYTLALQHQGLGHYLLVSYVHHLYRL